MTQRNRTAGLPIPTAIVLALAGAALLGAGCKKEQESLVIAQLELDAPNPQAATALSLSLTAMPGPTRIFPLSAPLSDTQTTDLGIYLDSNISGDVSIVAIARPPTGCVGFRGTGHVQIVPGATKTTMITMTLAPNVCPSDGGAAGSGGNTGAGGSGGSAGATAGTTGTGGAAAGTTGAAGRGGSGGSVGAAGTTGTGGSTAGTTGRGGTTGTGGMAGYPSIANCRPFIHDAANSFTYVKGLAVAPNGKTVVSAGDDYHIKVWNFDGRTLTAAGPVINTNFSNGYHLAFSADGTKFAFTDGPSVRIYTVSNWTAANPSTLMGDGGTANMVGCGFTPDGTRVVSADDKGSSGGNVYVHDVNGSGLPLTGALLGKVTHEPWSFAISPRAVNGSTAVAVGAYDGTISVLSLASTGFSTSTTTLMTHAAGSPVDQIQFSADGTLLAEGDDYGSVRFWSVPVTSTTPLADSITMFAGGDSVNALALSPNGMYVAVGGAFFTGVLAVYNVATQTELMRWSSTSTPPLNNDILSLAFSPDGQALIGGLDDANSTVLVCN